MTTEEKMNWTDLSNGATRQQVDNILAGAVYRPVAVNLDGERVAVLLSVAAYERLAKGAQK